MLKNKSPIEDALRAEIAELKKDSPILCAKCNDHIVANDGAICGTCAETNETIIQEFATMTFDEFALWQHQLKHKTAKE